MANWRDPDLKMVGRETANHEYAVRRKLQRISVALDVISIQLLLLLGLLGFWLASWAWRG